MTRRVTEPSGISSATPSWEGNLRSHAANGRPYIRHGRLDEGR
ncbi:hypothetical protein T261_2957 [Streptomyces lydicus]|nr:hypothetical protein T261_2957 [Streptomyces lydicus]